MGIWTNIYNIVSSLLDTKGNNVQPIIQYKPIRDPNEPFINTKEYEGLRYHVYTDTTGHATVGYGHLILGPVDANLASVGVDRQEVLLGYQDLTKDQAEALFEADKRDTQRVLKTFFPTIDSFPPLAIDVINDLGFNLGPYFPHKWPLLSNQLNSHQWVAAANNLNNSKWYGQVNPQNRGTGNRGYDIVHALNYLGSK